MTDRDHLGRLLAAREQEIERLEAENAKLRQALEPFKWLDLEIGDEWRDVCLAAREALGDA